MSALDVARAAQAFGIPLSAVWIVRGEVIVDHRVARVLLERFEQQRKETTT